MITIDALWMDALHADWRHRTALKHSTDEDLWVQKLEQAAAQAWTAWALEVEKAGPDLDDGDFADPDWIEGESISLPEG